MVKVAEDLQVLAFSEMKGMIKKVLLLSIKLHLNMGKWGVYSGTNAQLRQAIFNQLSVAWRC
jgi:hypothetical protein